MQWTLKHTAVSSQQEKKWNYTQLHQTVYNGKKKGWVQTMEWKHFLCELASTQTEKQQSCGRMKNSEQRRNFVSGFAIGHKDTHTNRLSHAHTKWCFSYKLFSKPSVKLFWANLKVASHIKVSDINHVIACTVLWRHVSLKPWKAKISH